MPLTKLINKNAFFSTDVSSQNKCIDTFERILNHGTPLHSFQPPMTTFVTLYPLKTKSNRKDKYHQLTVYKMYLDIFTF